MRRDAGVSWVLSPAAGRWVLQVLGWSLARGRLGWGCSCGCPNLPPVQGLQEDGLSLSAASIQSLGQSGAEYPSSRRQTAPEELAGAGDRLRRVLGTGSGVSPAPSLLRRWALL